MIVIASVAPKSRQPVLLGVVTSVFTMTEVLGPLVGGALTAHASWRWCMLGISLCLSRLTQAPDRFLDQSPHWRRNDGDLATISKF
jgi:MFS family permease